MTSELNVHLANCERLRALYQNQGPILFANLAVGVVFSGVHGFTAQVLHVWWWFLSLSLVLALRYWNFLQFSRDLAHLDESPERVVIWLRRFRIGVVASATIWSLGGLFFVSSNDPLQIAYAILALGGMCAGSVNALALDRWSGLAFLLITPTPALLVLLSSGGAGSFGLALFFIIGVLFVALTSKRGHLLMMELVSLRVESDSATKAIQQNEQRLKRALHGSGLAIWEWDVLRNQELPSASWLGILGFETKDDSPVQRSQVDGQVADQVEVHPDDQSALMLARRAVIEERSMELDIEYRCRHKQGYWVWVHERGMANERGYDGQLLSIVGTREDVTENRLMQEQLQHSEKIRLIGQLAGGVAHDFNNNLTAMSMSIDLLAAEEGTAESREVVGELREMVDRASQTTKQLLMFARRGEIRADALELADRMRRLADMLKRLLGERTLLTLQLNCEEAYVVMDPNLLDQAIINLAVNARDAMPEGGAATLSLDRKTLTTEALRAHPGVPAGEFACIALRDTGVGMDSAVQKRIFEPFFTTKAVDKGTGLGLASVLGLVEQHHGFISVESAPGAGSTFSIFLPLMVAPNPANNPRESETAARSAVVQHISSAPRVIERSAPSPQAIRAPAAEPAAVSSNANLAPRTTNSKPGSAPRKEHALRILMVDDEASVREALARMLKFLGHELSSFPEAASALAAWSESPQAFDVVMTDLLMPGQLNGLEFALKVRAQAAQLPIVLMSGYSPEHLTLDLQEAIRNHQLRFLSKPFNFEELRSVLALPSLSPHPG
jgi:signal transduction histidine kinase/ActR/RegA family two-component response regulator